MQYEEVSLIRNSIIIEISSTEPLDVNFDEACAFAREVKWSGLQLKVKTNSKVEVLVSPSCTIISLAPSLACPQIMSSPPRKDKEFLGFTSAKSFL